MIQVVVKSHTDEDYRHEVGGPVSERKAEKVILGLLRNMGDDYWVDEEVVPDV